MAILLKDFEELRKIASQEIYKELVSEYKHIVPFTTIMKLIDAEIDYLKDPKNKDKEVTTYEFRENSFCRRAIWLFFSRTKEFGIDSHNHSLSTARDI